mmetsp:Transcript_23612/g.67854  ORF Transcript_23612/g.67854 Transcript_23612/m.67854 type:complete len:319 (-) Transcript_23612:302-1258(-)
MKVVDAPLRQTDRQVGTLASCHTHQDVKNSTHTPHAHTHTHRVTPYTQSVCLQDAAGDPHDRPDQHPPPPSVPCQSRYTITHVILSIEPSFQAARMTLSAALLRRLRTSASLSVPLPSRGAAHALAWTSSPLSSPPPAAAPEEPLLRRPGRGTQRPSFAPPPPLLVMSYVMVHPLSRCTPLATMLAHDGAAGVADSDEEEDDDATPMVLPLLLLLLPLSAAAAAAAVGGSLVSESLGVFSVLSPPDAREVAVLSLMSLWELGEEGWTTTDWEDADEGEASSPSNSLAMILMVSSSDSTSHTPSLHSTMKRSPGCNGRE